jgi:hypothetical protein
MPIHASGGRALEGLSASFSKRTDFTFLPKSLLEKCTQFIMRYHELNGYSCLPDILWHPEIRNFIEIDATFRSLFKKSTSSRSAKRANEGLVCIATAILAMEVLSTGFAGWGSRYPEARKKAQALLQEYIPSQRAWLIKRYLNPQKPGPDPLETFVPPERSEPIHKWETPPLRARDQNSVALS